MERKDNKRLGYYNELEIKKHPWFFDIDFDELVNKIYCPVRARQSIMRIIIYCTDSTEVEFVDEPGVSKLGELSIDLGKAIQGDKTVTVTMRFGATSIMVTVTNKRGEARNCEFKFDSK